jgi:hypothetical protein
MLDITTAAEAATVVNKDVLTHYCIVRDDLPKGAQAAQLIHAAGESSPGNLPPHTFAIALAARDEEHLKQISWELFKNKIKHKLIFEPDPPYNGSLMAIGIVPMERSKIKPLMANLPLLK